MMINYETIKKEITPIMEEFIQEFKNLDNYTFRNTIKIVNKYFKFLKHLSN
jgi:hypothetical protein